MTRRHIHYEAAFEDYLRSRGQPYVAVDEKRKAIFSGNRVKSFDFLVYGIGGRTGLVDIKGRQFPYDHDGKKRYWENWITRDDLDGLTQWQSTFGEGFLAMLVFAYHITQMDSRLPTHHLHPFRDQIYAFMCVTLDEYKDACRHRSEKWETVTVPIKQFKAMAKPIQSLAGNNSLRASGACL